MEGKSKTLSIVALVCSIVSWVVFWWLAFVGATLGIVALTDSYKSKGTVAMSIISIVVSVVGIVVFFASLGAGA